VLRALVRPAAQALPWADHADRVPTWLIALAGAGCVLTIAVWALSARGPGVHTVSSTFEGPGQSNKIELMKRYRAQHGVRLKETTEAVEAQERGEHVAPPAPLPTSPSIEALIQAGNVSGPSRPTVSRPASV
jgi:hypothetical protein